MSSLPFGRRLRAGFEINLHLLEAFAENVFNVLVPVRKFAEHLAQQPGDFLIRQGHDPGDDSPRDVVGGGTKRAQQHARTVRGQGWPDAFGVESGSMCVVVMNSFLPSASTRAITRRRVP